MQAVEINTLFEESKITTVEKIETEVRTIEMNPENGSLYDRTQASEELICEAGDLKMPKPLALLVQTIKNQHPERSINSIINTVLAKNAQMLTAKRIKHIEKGSIGYCNYYAINFMPSGAGKDRMSDELDNFVYYPFRKWFEFTADTIKQNHRHELEQKAKREFPGDDKLQQRQKYVKEQMKEFGNMVMEVADGTREGLFRDAKIFKKAEFGSLMLKIAELGQYLNSITTEQRLFFNVLFEAYDGKIPSKCIKGEQREEDIKDLPVNTLFYSDPTLFKLDLAKEFDSLMKAGFSRRFIITFMPELEPYEMEPDGNIAYEAEKKYYSDLKAIGLQIYKIFESIEYNAQYEITKKTFVEVLYPYKHKLKEMFQKESNPIIKSEIKSRYLKVVKIADQYASVNHPKEHFINPKDMEMAIDTVEKLSTDLRKFLSYRPTYSDKCDRIFQFFLENIGKEFKKNELTTIHFKQFGCSRDKFKKSFDDDMQSVTEIAQYNGYQLLSKPINNNSGHAYWLTTAQSKDLNAETQELEDLI